MKSVKFVGAKRRRSVTPHHWSKKIDFVFIGGYVCKGCGARILTGLDFPSSYDMKRCDLPLDCDESVIIVIHDAYKAWIPTEEITPEWED